MKRLGKMWARQEGYTIIETLIVMSASSMLVLGVIVLISGQQGKTQFSQAMRDADSRLADMMNNYATGYYARPANISCSPPAPGSSPTLTASPGQQGKSVGCAFVGMLVNPTGGSNYNVHTMVGRQYMGGILSDPVDSLPNAKPVLAYPVPDLSLKEQFSAGIKLSKATYTDTAGTAQPAGAFGVVSSFGVTNAGGLVSDKQTPQLFVLTTAYASDADLALNFSTDVATSKYVLNRPMTLCFVSGTSEQHGIIEFGTTNGGSVSTIVTISGGTTCP